MRQNQNKMTSECAWEGHSCSGRVQPFILAPGLPRSVGKRPTRGGEVPPDPRPGAPRLLPARTLAPRSLSHSKSPVPSTKLLPLAKEGKEGDKSKQRTEKIHPPHPRRHFSHSEQSGSLELGEGATRVFTQSPSRMCPPFTLWKHSVRASHQDHGHFWAWIS